MTVLERYRLSEADAAKQLGIKTNTLTQWRRRGQGPCFLRPTPKGRVRYSVEDLESWMLSKVIDPADRKAKPKSSKGGKCAKSSPA
jgi:hypothetical protein